MWDEHLQRFITLLRPLFRDDAEIRIRPEQDGVPISVCWKLGTDPRRPNKRSKRIILFLPEEVLDDYEDGSELQREAFERRMLDKVTERLKVFDPNHESPHGHPEPEERWTLI